MKILIEGGGFVNKGAEAMVATLATQIHNRLPYARFMMDGLKVSSSLSSLASRYQIELLDLTSQSLFFDLASWYSLCCVSPSESLWFLKYLSTVSRSIALLQHVNAVIDISGFRYSDQFMSPNALPWIAFANMINQLSLPYLFAPQSWGPFDQNIRMKDWCHSVCHASPLICVRDRISQMYLASLLNMDQDDIPIYPDITFVLEPDFSQKAAAIFKNNGFSPGHFPFIVLVPSARLLEKNRFPQGEEKCKEMFVQIGRAFLSMDVDVLILPHAFEMGKMSADYRLADEIHQILKARSLDVDLLNLSAAEIKSILNLSDLVVSSRYHALIGALSCKCSAVALGWAHKYGELMGEFHLDENIIDFMDCSIPDAVNICVRAWNNRMSHVSKLDPLLDTMRKRIHHLFDQFVEILTGHE